MFKERGSKMLGNEI